MNKLSLLLAVLFLMLSSSTADAQQAAAAVKVTTNSTAGTILTDATGRTLYLFTRDERNKSTCSGSCAQTWPPLLTAGAPTAGGGAAATLLGTITRDDRSTQVTYNGRPLHYFSRDEQPGDAKGQNIAGVWFVVSPYGGPRQTNASVKVTANPALGSILTDASGRTLYLLTRDEPNKSTCSAGCPQLWPPLLSIGPAKTEPGVAGELLGLLTREEGSTQVTYKGWPLHYYSQDEKPGDTKGQNFGTVWFVVSPAGAAITAPAPAAAPAALPRTGDSFLSLATGVLSLLALAAIGTGLLLRRRAA